MITDLRDGKPSQLFQPGIPHSTQQSWEAWVSQALMKLESLKLLRRCVQELEHTESDMINFRRDETPPGYMFSPQGDLVCPPGKAQPPDKQHTCDKTPPQPPSLFSYGAPPHEDPAKPPVNDHLVSQSSHQDSSVGQSSNGHVSCSPPHGDPTKPPLTVHPVIDHQFILGYPLDLGIPKASADEDVVIQNGTGETWFTVKSGNPTLHCERTVLDAKGVSLAKLRGKMKTGVHLQGDTSKKYDFEGTIKVKVSLEKNGCSDDIDLTFTGSRSTQSCTMFMGDSSIPIAHIYHSYINGKDLVKVWPNVDHALVIALIVVVGDMEVDESVVCPSVMCEPSDDLLNSSFPVSGPDEIVQHKIGDVPRVTGLEHISEGIVKFISEKSATGECFVSEAESGGRVKFSILSCHTHLHHKLKLLDDNGVQVAKICLQNVTFHHRCDGYIYSGSKKKKAFSISRDHMFKNHNELHVNLLNSSSGGICDYKVTVNMTDKSFIIYKGNSSTKIAQTRPLEGNKDKFMLEIDPDEDHKFMLSVFVAVDAMNSPSKLRVAAGHTADLANKLVGGALFGLGKYLFDGVSQGGF